MPRHRFAGLLLALLALQPRAAGAAARLLQYVEQTTSQRLDQPIASVVSPDGAFVYVGDAPYYDRRITSFSRDLGTGELSFLEVVQGGIDGVGNLQPVALALSPDGAHLYAAGSSTLTVLSRDAGTGLLTWVETEQNGVGGVTGLNDAQEIVVSPDGAHVYVTSWLPGAVVTFSRNATTGEVSFVEALQDGAPNGLYGANGLAVSADGAHVYVAGYYDDALITFSRNAGTGALTLVETDVLDAPTNIAVSGDGAHVYVTSYYDRLSVYGRDAGTGALAFAQVLVDGIAGITAMAGPSDVTVTPDGAHVLVSASSDSAILVFGRNAGTGTLTFVQEKVNNVGGIIGLNGATSVAVTADGADVYATASGYYYYGPPALTGFARDAGTGALTQFEYQTSGNAPAAMALSPDGAHLYGAGGSQVSVWARDGGTGSLSFAGLVADGFDGVDGISGASDVVMSADGAHVYVVGSGESALAAFSRNPTTGALTSIEVERDGVGGVDGLWDAQSVAMSADDAYLYVSGRSDRAVAVFSRDAGTGQLTFVQVVRDGVGGVDGIYYMNSFALSPDGGHLYVASTYDGLATFSRDAGTGMLTQTGLLDFADDHPDRVAVSPDSAFVYVVYPGARDLIRVFSRSPVTGALTLASTIKSSEGGLEFPSYYADTVLFSADGGAAFYRGAIFARNAANGSLAFVAPLSGGPGYLSGGAVVGPNDQLYIGASGTSIQLYEPGFAGCEGGPLPVCASPSGGILRLGAAAPSFTWTWKSAATVLPGDFGSPATTDHYALCLWDESGPTPTLVMRSLAPAAQLCTASKGCWTPSATGFNYRDRARTPEGLGSILLKAGAGDGARVKVVAGKGHLAAPSFPLPLPIRVQLQSSAGACFEATFSASSFNNTLGFLGKPD
jgi:6-phosphogluconolactonase (cycloisomerase 2 family)